MVHAVSQQGVVLRELPHQIPEQGRDSAVGISAAVSFLCLLHDKWICHFNILLEQASQQLTDNAKRQEEVLKISPLQQRDQAPLHLLRAEAALQSLLGM